MQAIVRIDGEHSRVVRDSFVVIERPRTISGKARREGLAARAANGESLAEILKRRSEPAVRDAAGRMMNSDAGREIWEMRTYRVSDVLTAPHSAYNLSGKATTVTLLQEDVWGGDTRLGFGIIRRAKVHAASERLILAERPAEREIGKKAALNAAGKLESLAENPFAEDACVLVLNRLCQGLTAGRRLLISGERADSVSARQGREYALVSKVEHVLNPSAADPAMPLPGASPHTRLTLEKDLDYRYRRSTVTVFGNVAGATHGETKREVLGQRQCEDGQAAVSGAQRAGDAGRGEHNGTARGPYSVDAGGSIHRRRSG